MPLDTRPEQRLLKLSIIATIGVGAVGVASGVLMGSQAILFDGMYSLVDVVLTTAALAVSRLVAFEGSTRFQYGYWHLEPMVEAFGGAILALSCVYAAVSAALGLLSGGHPMAFGFAMAWAGVLCAIGIAMSAYMRRQARRLQSGLLALDARSWMVSGGLSLALLVGFGGALLMEGGPLERWIPYVDPAVLLLIALAMLPVPMRATWRAVREVLQVAPGDLDREVKAAMEQVVADHGFLDFTSHVAKFGRAKFVEIHVLVRPDHRFDSIADADGIRREIATLLDAERRRFWLTVDFTGDRAWL